MDRKWTAQHWIRRTYHVSSRAKTFNSILIDLLGLVSFLTKKGHIQQPQTRSHIIREADHNIS